MNEYKVYYEIEWYDDSYAGCWRTNNSFSTLEEAEQFILSGKCLYGKELRIVRKTFEVVRNNINNKKDDDNMMESKQQIVQLKERTEIRPCFYIDKDVKGIVKETTVPEYYLVEFEGYGAYWVDGKHLIKHN